MQINGDLITDLMNTVGVRCIQCGAKLDVDFESPADEVMCSRCANSNDFNDLMRGSF